MNWINEWLNENLWNSNYHLSSQLSGGHWVLQQSTMIEINLSIVSPNPKIIQISESDATYLPPRLPLALPQFHRAYLGVLHLVYACGYILGHVGESLTSGSGHLPGNSAYYFFHGICTKGSRPVQWVMEDHCKFCLQNLVILANKPCTSMIAISERFYRLVFWAPDLFTGIVSWKVHNISYRIAWTFGA